MSPELRILLNPRRAYGQGLPARGSYILYYVFFFAALIAVAASAGATGRVTLSLLFSLAVCWMFVPVLHIATAAALVASASSPRVRGRSAVAALLMGHAPWSLWLLLASPMLLLRGFALYPLALLLAFVPIVLTVRIVHAFCLEILGTSSRGAILRTLAHQGVTWLIAAVYLDRAVSLIPRIQGWLS